MIAAQEPLPRICLLGSFVVERGDRFLRAEDWSRKKAAALLKRLAYEHRMIKDQAIEFLWPGSDMSSGSNNLYRALYSLRQTLDTSLGSGTPERLFSFEDGVLHLKDAVWVDAMEFESLCKIIPGEPLEQHMTKLNEALALYLGNFLPDDRYEDWTQLPRESLIRLHREACLTLARHHLDLHDFPVVIDLLSPLLLRDPADERVHRELMRAYALTGRRHDALRQYQACVDALASEIDAPPGAPCLFRFCSERPATAFGARQRSRLCRLTGMSPLSERAHPRGQERRVHQRTDFNEGAGDKGSTETISPIHH